MKLNFWQWIGLLLLIVGGFVYWYERRETAPQPPVAPKSPTLTSAPA